MKMQRQLTQKMLAWKNSPRRKPLIIQGARQVGKTWLMKDFGQTQYESVAYVNLEKNSRMQELFGLDYDVQRILNGLELETGRRIMPGRTLIILDEIQEIPAALTALKYFNENANDYHIMVAGSLLGVALHAETSFPVGKVDFLELLPMSLVEFLWATGNAKLAELLTSESPDQELIKSFASRYLDLLKHYYVVGGMPEVVKNYAMHGDLLDVRAIQRDILEAYEQDFSKHAPHSVVPKIREIWSMIVRELAKENKKFIFSLIREGARAKDYELALLWLADAGLVRKVHRVNAARIPLQAYAATDIFKLFLLDVGLLGAMGELDSKAVLEGNKLFTEFKGAMTEQYVAQELRAAGIPTYYYASDDSRGEIDFMVQLGDRAVPLEVKSAENLTSKSLDAFIAKTGACMALKASMRDYRVNEVIINIPLYEIGELC